MTVPEYLSSQIKYLEEEKERLNEYIDPIYHDKINAVNYQYLFGQFKEKFEITDEMVEKDSEKQENSQIQIIQKYQNYIIQSTLTKIMKWAVGNKANNPSLEWLVDETTKQIDLFKAQPQQIKENIEKLIEKGIIKRAEQNLACYEYIA